MTEDQVNYIINTLGKVGIQFDKGLTDAEIGQIEDEFKVNFPPDLKLFLQTALPISQNFVNWRQGLGFEQEAAKIMSRIDWPLNGMLFDVKSNGFWIDSWGLMPESIDDRISIAKTAYQEYEKLIPIYSHRYIPSLPNENDNPVFSVYQMDIIYYGYNLPGYFSNEFKFSLRDDFEILREPKKGIKFWTAWIDDRIPFRDNQTE